MSNKRKPKKPARDYCAETADAARDAIAFTLAVHRDDTTAIAAIFNNSDQFDLAHMLARYFIDFIGAMAVTSTPPADTQAQTRAAAKREVTNFLTSVQAEQREAAR